MESAIERETRAASDFNRARKKVIIKIENENGNENGKQKAKPKPKKKIIILK